jgi:hypothetical protein
MRFLGSPRDHVERLQQIDAKFKRCRELLRKADAERAPERQRVLIDEATATHREAELALQYNEMQLAAVKASLAAWQWRKPAADPQRN